MKKVFASALSIVAGVAIAGSAVADSSSSLVKELTDLAIQHPEDANVRVRLGSVLNTMGYTHEAQQWLSEAERLDPSLGDLSDAGTEYGAVTVRGGAGPDVWVCTLPGISNYGLASGQYGYAVATTSSNQGNQNLTWLDGSNQHPVIGQNLYQWYQGNFRQIGQSWLKHGFCALQNSGCGSCQPAGGGCVSALGPGCADPYSSGLNGSQSRLGPKHEVNPTTGVFNWPHSFPSGSNANRGRLLVDAADAIPTSSGATYWVEGQYIHPEDSHTSANHSLNNATHASTTMSANSSRSLSFPSQTFSQQPAIFSWQAVDPSVEIQLVTADGYIYAGGSATDLGGGTWKYQYNVFNLDSNNGVDSLTVNYGAGVSPTNATFNSPGWHSGSIYDNTPWTTSAARGSGFTWSVASPAANDNRVRWATMYSFTFEADAAPETGTVSLNVPGTGVFDVSLPVPAGSACVGDLDSSGTVDGGDLAALLAGWGSAATDLSGDGNTDGTDLAVLLAGWGACL